MEVASRGGGAGSMTWEVMEAVKEGSTLTLPSLKRGEGGYGVPSLLQPMVPGLAVAELARR